MKHLSTILVILIWFNAFTVVAESGSSTGIKFTENTVDESAGGLACYRIETPNGTYYLEKSGAGLSSLVDSDGNDWINFHPRTGSRASGEYRGFPNAVHRQAGNYFHPRNDKTDTAATMVENADAHHVAITAVSSNRLWACRFDFYPTHCAFTMTRMPEDYKYWVLYEGTPGGQYDDTDWWMTSQITERIPLTTRHDGDIKAPEWICFGDQRLERTLVLIHHNDDAHPDRFYAMNRQMTVFGFGRSGIKKHLDRVPQRFSILLVDTKRHHEIDQAARRILSTTVSGVLESSH